MQCAVYLDTHLKITCNKSHEDVQHGNAFHIIGPLCGIIHHDANIVIWTTSDATNDTTKLAPWLLSVFSNCPSATLKQMTLRIFNHMFIYLYLLWTLNLVTVFLWLANRKEVPQQQSGALPCTPRGHYSTSHELCTRFALVMFDYNLLQAEFSHTQCKPGNPEPVMHTWRISVHKSHGSNNIFTTTQTKQSATKPCVYVIMMTSSNGSFSALLAHCVGNSPVTGGGFSSQRASNGDFDASLM